MKRKIAAVLGIYLAGTLIGCGRNAATGTAMDVDIDLTALSSTMVYSEVFNMLYEPEDYIGKTVRMEGLFSTYHSETTGKDYYSCIIEDATACCSQGLEFALTEGYSYPKEGTLIEVVGVFDTYEEGEYVYCTLKDAVLEVG